MPCDQVQEVTIEFGSATDMDALAETLEALGLRDVQVSRDVRALTFAGGEFRDGQITFFDQRRAISIETLKRAYTKATVLRQSERFGWVAKVAKKAAVTAGFSRKW